VETNATRIGFLAYLAQAGSGRDRHLADLSDSTTNVVVRGFIFQMDDHRTPVAQSVPEGAAVVGESLRFESFFDREARTLFRRLYAVTGDAGEAEEIMQDAFLALWERWERVGAMDDPTGYLYRTAMNVFRKKGRRAALAIRKRLALASDNVPFADIEAQQDAVAALRTLSPRQRAAVVLLDVLDYSSENAAQALGVTPGTVRGLASRARETLRQTMSEEA
jgi:RNA polymerase sigma factor (sigma-70 family)